MRILKFIGYSFGNFANTIAYQIFGNRINFYYVDVLGLNASVVGILWSIYGLWNAVNDPLMGQISDKTRSKFGRRVPYVALGAIPLGLSFFFLWTPPSQSPFMLAAYFLMILFIFDTLYSLTFIAYNALFPEVALPHVTASICRRRAKSWRQWRCFCPSSWRPSSPRKWVTLRWGQSWAP